MSAHSTFRTRSGKMHIARRGFTLIELISTMTILSAISASIAFILFTAIDGYLAGSVQAELTRNASGALDRMVRELRSVPLDGSATGTAPDLDRVDTEVIEWQGDRKIELIGSTVWIDTDGQGDHLLLDGVINLTVTAFDEDRTVVPLPATGDACDPIRRIQIELTVSRGGEVAHLRSLVHLRSTMNGTD